MEKYKNYVAGVIGIVAIVAGVSYFEKPVDVKVNVTKDGVDQVVNNLGSVVGPDSFFPVYNTNGVRTWPLRQSFTNGTGTVAVVQSPADATTTLAFRINVAIATGTATIIEVSTSTNAVSTSSVNRLGSLTLASGVRGTLVGTSTNFCFGGTTCSYNVGNGLSTTTVTNFARLTDIEIPPSTYVVVRVGAEYGGSANIVGNTFTTVFTEI